MEQTKYALSIKEASEAFGIGQNKLRTIVANNPNESFILRVGNRTKIKYGLFSKWLEKVSDL